MPTIVTVKKNSGELYLGLLLSLGIFSIVSVAVISLLVTSFNLISYAKARITARNLAEEAIEIIRNMPYDDVGTIGGIPSGSVEPFLETQKNGQTYIIKTDIVYIDDPYDGIVPDDLLPPVP